MSDPIQIHVYHRDAVSPENQLVLGNELKELLRLKPPVGLGLPSADVEIKFHFGSRLAYTVQIVLPEELLPMVPGDMDADGMLRRSLNNRYWRDDFTVRVVAFNPREEEEETEEEEDTEIPRIEVWHPCRLSAQRKEELAGIVRSAFGRRFEGDPDINFLIDESLKLGDPPLDYNIIAFVSVAAYHDPALQNRLHVTERMIQAMMRGQKLRFIAQEFASAGDAKE